MWPEVTIDRPQNWLVFLLFLTEDHHDLHISVKAINAL